MAELKTPGKAGKQKQQSNDVALALAYVASDKKGREAIKRKIKKALLE